MKKIYLLPFSWLYGFGIFIRNFLYNIGVFKQTKLPVFVISIGNITVGGTGKTPVSQFIISEALKLGLKPAYLSRGYGRKTKGFLIVDYKNHTSLEVGDEALQVANRFPEVPIVVSENRVNGIQQLLKEKSVDLVILDDAFQHRAIFRDIDVVMIDATNPPYEDKLLPFGRLREPYKNIKRANIVIISKSSSVSSHKLKQIKSKIKARRSTINYKVVEVINFENPQKKIPLDSIQKIPCIAFSGLANNAQFFSQLFDINFNVILTTSFKDHHNYTLSDFNEIYKNYLKFSYKHIFEGKIIIITTEKDYFRLKNNSKIFNSQLPLKDFYYVKIEVEVNEDSNYITEKLTLLKEKLK